jgi:PhnB protein
MVKSLQSRNRHEGLLALHRGLIVSGATTNETSTDPDTDRRYGNAQDYASKEHDMTVKPIPDGYHSLTPYLMVSNTDALVKFYQAAFDATVIFRMNHPDGNVRHGEVRIGDSMLMLSEARPGYPAQPTMLYLYVPDVDRVFGQAIKAGGTVVSAVVDHHYGDRAGGLTDPSGNTWWIATHIEDVSGEEVARREAAMAQNTEG